MTIALPEPFLRSSNQFRLTRRSLNGFLQSIGTVSHKNQFSSKYSHADRCNFKIRGTTHPYTDVRSKFARTSPMRTYRGLSRWRFVGGWGIQKWGGRWDIQYFQRYIWFVDNGIRQRGEEMTQISPLIPQLDTATPHIRRPGFLIPPHITLEPDGPIPIRTPTCFPHPPSSLVEKTDPL